ncbi:DUF4190 domain-containing protein [Micromonospora sp. DSM 115977]|uniref:DUF4190 domain-containing protein n=1 Tax=Micromonospora reichwaldensis TaxID=3075516 RepID=A0ABU2WRA6_9ACTN|nr:DUF4190 domain-containing protein [Micromonospora sp. DSM 115977]MDT0528448.1 DUF4190 domain-containing protein [Micromonospora sp. DSM 115977]
MQPGYPGQDPYGQQPHHDPTAPPPHDPYAPPPAAPYGQQPVSGQPNDPYAAPQDPYGQQNPYGQQDPYGQPPTSGQPYGHPAPGQPYGQQPYQDPYGQQGYPQPPMYPNAGFAAKGPGQQQNTLGLVSMILGIASIPLVCCYLGIPLGIGALVTGWMGKQKAAQGLADNNGQALAGLICGAIGVVLGLLQIVFLGFSLTLPNQP